MAISKAMKVEKGHEIEYHEDGPVIFHDADWIPYAIGSVCQTLVQTAYINGRKKFEAESKTELYEKLGVKDKAELTDKLANDPRWSKVTFEEEIVLEPIENVLHSVNATIQRIVNELGASDQKLYLTVGSTNFRNDVATLNKYKANRSGVEKPFYYEAIRDHMLAHHGAMISHGMEAEDDVVIEHYQAYSKWLEGLTNGIRKGEINPLDEGAMECPYVMVSVDKDTFQSAGQHYNPKTQELRWLSELGECRLLTRYHETKTDKKGNPSVIDRSIKFTGLKGLYLQALQGDDIDNIPGIKGYGPVKLFDTMNPLTCEQEFFDTVLQAWKDYVPLFMAEQDVEEEIRKNKWDYSYRGANAKDISAFRAKAKKLREKAWKSGDMSPDFHYYHWSQFVEDEFGAPTLDLKEGEEEKGRMTKTPYELLHEVMTLLWIRHYKIEEGEDVMAPIGKFRDGL